MFVVLDPRLTVSGLWGSWKLSMHCFTAVFMWSFSMP